MKQVKKQPLTLYAQRPKWAKNISRRVWRDLHDCQTRRRPTLKALLDDLADQEAKGIVCRTCVQAYHQITQEVAL